MNLPEIPLLDMLRQRMSWLNERQNVLSQNIANADTPGYMARDLKPLDFDDVLKKATAPNNSAGGLTTTNARHIAFSSQGPGNFADYTAPDIETSPTGNSVSLEQEMIKVADTQTQYQTATNLYSKALQLMRTAIGQG